VFWYLPRLRTTAQEEGFDVETWLNEDFQENRATAGEAEDEEFQSTTEEFDHLERPQQIRLLEQAARRALAAYPLQVESVELLRYVLNAEFVVQAHPDNGGNALKRYVLRVNAPGFHTRAEIASELIWLDALTRDTKLIVPVPVRTRTGGWVETVDHPALGIFRHCVLFEYLPASSAETAITSQRMEFLGALIALLHRHGSGFKPPAGFIRKHWDLEGMRGEMLDVPATQALAALEDDERRVLKEAEKLVAEAMNELGTGPEVYGLIHGDLHLKSLLFTTDNRPVVIDFDTCGWGYYVYDLAVAVWNIFNRDDFTVLRDALLKGYRKVRPLSRMEETLMIHFVAGRLMVQILTWAPRRAHSPLRETADKAIDRQVSQLKALLRILNE
jgi:Ser/Thr protein kinase RdoA (MazF antagonist)